MYEKTKKEETKRINTDSFLTEKIINSAKVQIKSNYFCFPRHAHYSMEIYEILSGQCNMDINSELVLCKQGDIIVLLPNVVHSFYLTSTDSCEYRQIHFEPAAISNIFIEQGFNTNINLLSYLTRSPLSFYQEESDSTLSNLIQGMISELQKPINYTKALANLHLIEFLLQLLHKYDMKHPVGSFSNLKVHNQDISFALEYIKNNYSGKILIQDIANSLSMSSRYLSRLFLQYTNMTILNYINNYRINRSIELMLNTDMSLTDISIQVGFCSQQHFSKIFHKNIGLSPYKYKKLFEH